MVDRTFWTRLLPFCCCSDDTLLVGNLRKTFTAPSFLLGIACGERACGWSRDPTRLFKKLALLLLELVMLRTLLLLTRLIPRLALLLSLLLLPLRLLL